jgi:hypothetical protein
MGWSEVTACLSHGKRFHKHRKMLAKHLNKDKVGEYQPLQLKESRIALQGLLNDPTRYKKVFDR